MWHSENSLVRVRHWCLGLLTLALPLLGLPVAAEQMVLNQLGSWPGHPRDAWSVGVAVVGSKAYLAAGAAGLQIFDVADPAHPRLLGFCPPNWSAENVVAAGRYAYLTEWIGGLGVIDVSDPQHPVRVASCAAGTARGVAIAGSYVYVASHLWDLHIFDVSVPEPPVQVAKIGTRGHGYAITVVGQWACVANGVFSILDVQNPRSPVTVSHYLHDSPVWDVTLAGNKAYLATGTGLLVLDVTDPKQPVKIGSLPPLDDHPFFYCALDGSRVFHPSGPTGLEAVDFSNPANPVRMSALSAFTGLEAWVVGLAYSEGRLFCALSEGGLGIVDASDPRQLVELGAYTADKGLSLDVALVGDRAFVADGVDGLQVLDVRNPSAPSLVANLVVGSDAQAVTSAGDRAYLADAQEGLVILDIHDPDRPAVLGKLKTEGTARDVLVSGSRAYVAASEKGVVVIDVGDPVATAVVGTATTVGAARTLAAAGDRLISTTTLSACGF